MGPLHLQSPPLTALPSVNVIGDGSSFPPGLPLPFVPTQSCLHAKNLKFIGFRGGIPGLARRRNLSNLGHIKAARQEEQVTNDDVAFVAGATGRVGSRAVRELLKLGFRVRADVRSKVRAEGLVQSVQQMKFDGEIQPVEKLEVVECDLEKREEIGAAIGNASVILCCIGAGEKEVFDITGPYRIDYLATKNLIDAATVAKVNHFILLTSLGTNKIGFPAAILNLFWGVLIWKRKAEEALLDSGLAYTIVRPGGMERPTDSYKETHNLVLAYEDTLFGGQVSNLQVAELMAFMAKNRPLSFCKVVEVIAETTAPLTPMAELLAKIPSPRVHDSLRPELQKDQQTDSKPSETRIAEAPTAFVEKTAIQTAFKEPRPLSPYSVYEDLKPPASPSPSPPSTKGTRT